jgi:predicted Zn-dependent peptidase
MHRWLIALTLTFVSATSGLAQQVEVQEVVLDNGMRVLLVPRKGDPNVAAGWIARVGSVNERPGITGLSHLFEHMMFKGTKTIGVKDRDVDDRVRAEMDEVKADLRVEEEAQIGRLRAGAIESLTDPATRTPRHRQLLERFSVLEQREKSLLIKNEFDRIYTAAGASGMNAGTDYDYTVYFINVPANKLELWFWMESDRLREPVFREFYSERDVVKEERRLRTDSTPLGKFEEEFESLFWNASPYAWPVVGWMSDLDGITREEALAYFATNYSPNNLTACLVGDFDPAEATALARRYLGRLTRSSSPPAPVRTREPEPQAEKRMVATADTSPQAVLRYHTVADGHADEPALLVLGALLSGRTGRLYRSLVLEQQVATRAGAGQTGRKYEGYFEIEAVAKPGVDPTAVERALAAELDKLKDAPVDARELQKVKNQFAADAYRRIEGNFALMIQLLLADSLRGWRTFNDDPTRLAAVTADDVQRVAARYFKPERRAVALYYTKQAAQRRESIVEAEGRLARGTNDAR